MLWIFSSSWVRKIKQKKNIYIYIWLNTTYFITIIYTLFYLSLRTHSHDTTIQAALPPYHRYHHLENWPINHPWPQATFSATLMLAWSDSEPKCWATALRTLRPWHWGRWCFPIQWLNCLNSWQNWEDVCRTCINKQTEMQYVYIFIICYFFKICTELQMQNQHSLQIQQHSFNLTSSTLQLQWIHSTSLGFVARPSFQVTTWLCPTDSAALFRPLAVTRFAVLKVLRTDFCWNPVVAPVELRSACFIWGKWYILWDDDRVLLR